jgi:DeoR/GlpR family transcriptional regulator of sugar metabolism
MGAEPRQTEILALLQRRGYVSIEGMAAHFSVTPQTIRRDINGLSDQGLVVRQHGGASLPSSIANVDVALRRVAGIAEKQRIAKAVADYLPDRASLFMTLGTTVEAIARALAETAKQMVIATNNPEVARILGHCQGFELFLTGGAVQPHNGGLVGPAALSFVQSMRCDWLVMSCGAIEADGSIFDYRADEVAVARAMMGNARRALIAADCGKFTRNATHFVGRLTDCEALATDAPPPATLRALARDEGLELIIAEE